MVSESFNGEELNKSIYRDKVITYDAAVYAAKLLPSMLRIVRSNCRTRCNISQFIYIVWIIHVRVRSKNLIQRVITNPVSNQREGFASGISNTFTALFQLKQIKKCKN
ncbi:2083_t:CDS:2 [Funneliformis mosseae]|uniref:2083_t:CDS:1 n=1 Tax=Funneliformis mosseae TaxID=27381 RepID=A0A9N9E516_FUNMO|nr:2083_t:CDS:2 [Funneliformis mosseae]